MRFALALTFPLLVLFGTSEHSFAQSRKVARPTMGSPEKQESKAPFFPEMMPYEQFKALSKSAQVKYIRELRNMMVLLSDSSGWEQASFGPLPKWQNWLDSIIQVAEARGTRAQGCPAGYAWGRHPKAPRTMGCYPIPASGIKCAPGFVPFVVAEDGHTCQRAPSSNGTCPAGMIRLEGHNGDNTAACVRSDNGGLTDVPGSTLGERPEGVPENIKPTDEKIAGRPAIAGLPQDDKKPTEKPVDKPKEGEGNPLSEADKKFFSEALTGKHMKSDGTLGKDVDKSTEEKPTASTNKCWWDEMKCAPVRGNKQRQALRKQFADMGCIYAGNLSSYKDPSKPKAGQCQAVSEVAFGGKNFSCSGKGQSLCNPLIFGVEDFSSGKGHCVKGENSTMECAKKGDANKTAGFIQSLEPSIAKAEWDKMREGLKKLVASCIHEEGKGSAASKASSAFHCKECQVIAKRVVELRKVAASNMAEMNCDIDGVKPVVMGVPEGPAGTTPEGPGIR